MDMQQLLAAAQQMQHQLMNAQQELADTEVEGTAGGGLVTATVNGQGELVDLTSRARRPGRRGRGAGAQRVLRRRRHRGRAGRDHQVIKPAWPGGPRAVRT